MEGKAMNNELCIELEKKLIECEELNNVQRELIDDLTEQLEQKQDKLDQIEAWTQTYPLKY